MSSHTSLSSGRAHGKHRPDELASDTLRRANVAHFKRETSSFLSLLLVFDLCSCQLFCNAKNKQQLFSLAPRLGEQNEEKRLEMSALKKSPGFHWV